MPAQPTLFDAPPVWPEGFDYRPDFISSAEEKALVADLETLTYEAYQFRGFEGRRKVAYFGARYDGEMGRVAEVGEPPAFLQPLKEKAAAFAGLAAADLRQVLVNMYEPGAPIGWHRDRPQFGEVIGVSLLSPCPFRFRRKRGERDWERITLTVEPRSAYRLSGPARSEWEHSIPPAAALRYSVTFRTLR